MKEIRIHGRGGQGNVKAAEFIAMAAFYEGMYSQAYPVFGVERKGAPVTAFIRMDDSFIRVREQVYTPDYLLIQDRNLIMHVDVFQGCTDNTRVLINTRKDPNEVCPGRKNVYCIPAYNVAMEVIGKPIINTAMIGAFAKLSDDISLGSIKRAVRTNLGRKYGTDIVEKNLQALEKAYKMISL